ncbi:MAG: phenylacetate--CoA ligase, partial [Firmicutes bacterium HGW-Firmicutes-13]
LMDIKGVAPYYQIVVERKGYLDDMEVQVELEKEMFTGSFRDLEFMERKIKSKLHAVLSIDVTVKLVEPKSLQRSEGKSQRVIDKRNI